MTRRFIPQTLAAIIIVGLGHVQSVHASSIAFSDRSAFNNAVGPHELFAFDSIDNPCAVFNPANFTCILSYGPVQFAFDFAGVPSGPDVLHLGVGGQAFSTILTAPVMALGFDIAGASPGGYLNILLQTVHGNSLAATLTAPNFFGAMTDVDDAFTTLFVQVGPAISRPVVSIDNLAVQSVPEPAPLVLLALSALALLTCRRLRLKRSWPALLVQSKSPKPASSSRPLFYFVMK